MTQKILHGNSFEDIFENHQVIYTRTVTTVCEKLVNFGP